MAAVWNALSDLLFPPRCPFCSALLKKEENGLCSACQSALPWVPPEKQGFTGEFFETCVAPLWYKDRVRASFHRYKFRGMARYASLYGTLLGECVADCLPGRYDLLTWVPLDDRRRRERGYDQSFLLARTAAETLGTEVTGTLRKVRHAPPQSGLKEAAARRANVLGNYEVLDPARVADRRVLLVDDVVTTGATLSECARVLRTAGASEVVCAAFARA